ncbi:MAG: LytR/AlgR family response regulator transcription factor [Saprospiraceae bacterium]
MKAVQILIIEEDPLQAAELERFMMESGYQAIPMADNSDAVHQLVYTNQVDLAIIDISLKGRLNGIELAVQLLDQAIPVIFITAYDDEQTYLQAKQVHPQAYLVKPIKKVTLQHAIEVALMHNRQPFHMMELLARWQDDLTLKDYVFLKSADKVINVNLSEVAIIQAEGNYCILYLAKERHVVKMSLKRIKQKVSMRRFIQIHRSYLVQIPYIEVFNNQTETITILDKSVPVGVTFRADLLKRLNFLED